MSKLVALVNQIRSVRAVATKSLDGLSPESRPGWEAAKNQAIATLEKLMDQYREAVRDSANVTLMQVDPSEVAALAEAAMDSGSLVVNADALYMKLAMPAERMMGSNRVLTVGQVDRIVEELSEEARELGLASIPRPKFERSAHSVGAPDFASLVALVRDTVREAMGDSLNALWIESLVAKHALEAELVEVQVTVLATDPASVGKLPSLMFGGRTKVEVVKKTKTKKKKNKTESDDTAEVVAQTDAVDPKSTNQDNQNDME